MDINRIGILVTIITLVIFLGIIGIESSSFTSDFCDFPINCGGFELPQINAGTNTNNDGFYDYCYRMGFDC